MKLKQSQVGTVIGVVAAVQAVYSEVANGEQARRAAYQQIALVQLSVEFSHVYAAYSAHCSTHTQFLSAPLSFPPPLLLSCMQSASAASWLLVW
jgi:hypothetical protein